MVFAKAYHPEGKRKIEAFNRRINSFLSEAAFMDIKSLDELNAHFEVCISQH